MSWRALRYEAPAGPILCIGGVGFNKHKFVAITSRLRYDNTVKKHRIQYSFLSSDFV